MSSDESKVVIPSPRPVRTREIQLINRSEEMRRLREAADRAIQGEGGVVFLYGEAGIGKTRLARELGIYARSRGMQVLAGRCPALFRMDGVPPYVLWEEVIRDYLETCTPEQLFRVIGSYPVEISKLVPELKHKLRTFPQSFPLNPEHSRDRLFEAVSQFITNISRENPLLVILDDLQWTDQSSLLLLHYLARGVDKETLLILGAYRETYIDKKHPLSPVLAELNRERLLESIPIKRFSPSDTSEMVKRILTQEDISKEFCELVYKRTGGNPFFIEEVIKSLKEEEIIYRRGKEWKIKDITTIEFPGTVKDVIRMRISRLGDESQNILTFASFIGKDFTIEALQEVVGIDENKLLELLDKILKAGLFKHQITRGKDICSFADIIVRDVVHDEISPFKRKRLHHQVGQALEKVYGKEIDDHLGELALHFLEGGDKEKALSYFLKAGENAAKIYANAEAISYFQSAFQILEDTDGESREKGRILERLGDIKRFSGKHEEGLNNWNDALILWRQLREKEKVAKLHRKMANVLWEELGKAKKAEEHHNKARDALPEGSVSVEMAKVYEDMAHMYYRTGDLAKAFSWGMKALELGERLEDFEVLANSYASLGTISGFKGEREKSREYLEKAEKFALDKGYIETALRAKNNLATILPPDESEKIFELQKEAYELAKKVGHTAFQSWTGFVLAFAYFEMGRMDEAMLHLDESYILDKRSGNLAHLPSCLMAYGGIHQLRGEWDQSLRYYEEALNLAKKSGEFQMIGGIYDMLGGFFGERGDYARALDFYEKEVAIAKEAGAMYLEMWAYSSAAYPCIELGKLEKASEMIEKIKKAAPELKDRFLDARVEILDGMFFRAQKKWKNSITHFENALQRYTSLNAEQWRVFQLARFGLYEYARVYLERDLKGDGDKALALLNQALALFQKMDATVYIEKINAQIIRAKTGSPLVPEIQPAAVEVHEPTGTDRVSTGSKDLDRLLLGGIPIEYAVVLTGASCDERDLLIQRFLESGTKANEITFYITCGRARGMKGLLAQHPTMNLFICNPQADKIIEDGPNIFKVQGVENLNDITIAITSALRQIGPSDGTPRRCCLEPVSDVLLHHQALQTRRWLTQLIPELKSSGFTILAVLDPGMHAPQEVRAILDLFEGEITLFKKKTEKGIRRCVKIEKMTGQKYLEDEFQLDKE